MNLLKKIKSPADVKKLSEEDLLELCAELREFLLNSVSKTGGHLASNLGVVELTVALHRVFDTSKDRLVFDVGHQSYVHKLLTGRHGKFDTLREFGGLSGFPKPSESVHDAFIAGHASNSISVALGMARARTLLRRRYNVVAVVGDGALTGGLSYEGLSDAGASGEPLVVILNDNGMSITTNVGGIARYLSRQRMKPSYLSFKKRYRRAMEIIPGGRHIYRLTHGIKNAIKSALLHCSMFEEMGFHYVGPVDGHDITRLTDILSWAKTQTEPVLIHVITQKGRGYSYSEETPDQYHGVSKFNLAIGVVPDCRNCFSEVFGKELLTIAKTDARICAITAAMTAGTGLVDFEKSFPRRFFDVGIAEGHGAAMAAGLASQGSLPVFAVYSTFLQRSYDMLIHDVSISDLHVVFAVDRAGLVGEDGETHHGVFDVAFLSSIPNMTVLAPASYAELREMLGYALFQIGGPVAIRYPKGSEGAYKEGGFAPSKCLRPGADFTIVTYGTSVNTALAAAEKLEKHGVSAEVIKLDYIKPVNFSLTDDSVRKTRRLLVLEECVQDGCVGQRIAAHLEETGIVAECVLLKNLGSGFTAQGSVDKLRQVCKIDEESVTSAVLDVFALGTNVSFL